MSSLERDVRIQQAVSAYEKGSHGGRVKFEIGGQQAEDHMRRYWDRMSEALNIYGLPIPDVDNLAFLDLGGGSDATYRDNGDDYKPYLVRYLAALGAPYVVNVDIGPQNPSYHDVYTHLQLELSDADDFSLPEELEKRGQLRQYDIVFSAMLVDEGVVSPSLASNISPGRLRQRIKFWSTQLLKQGGYLFLGASYYNGLVLVGNELVGLEEAKKR